MRNVFYKFLIALCTVSLFGNIYECNDAIDVVFIILAIASIVWCVWILRRD